jgi:hypothetical protein
VSDCRGHAVAVVLTILRVYRHVSRTLSCNVGCLESKFVAIVLSESTVLCAVSTAGQAVCEVL